MMILSAYDKLVEKGLKPYFQGKHKGLCTVPYTVLKDDGQLPTMGTNRTGRAILDVIIYVPLSSYPQIDNYTAQVKSALKELTNLRYTGNETSTIISDDKEAYTKSISYEILKKLEV